MRQPKSLHRPRALPRAVLELCVHLEERGLRTFSQGEGLLDDLRVARSAASADDTASCVEPAQSLSSRRSTRSLLCVARPDELLGALPRAVVTGEGARRVTQATDVGPVDLVPTGAAADGRRSAEEALLAFGLGPLSFGFRPADESWCDPADQLSAYRAGVLDLATRDPNPFDVAPRRYWIAARLMAEHALAPSEDLLAAARAAFEKNAERLPQAAPARRELARILEVERPAEALGFLRASGVSGFLFPGTSPANEERLALLPRIPTIRWAAWLRGSSTASALVLLRMPHALARRIERVQATHPIERSLEAGRDHGLRRLLQKHDDSEIEALLAWRRLELASARTEERPQLAARLDAIESRIREARSAATRSSRCAASQSTARPS